MTAFAAGAGVFCSVSSTGAGLAHWARHCAVGAEPRISVTGSHEDATRSSAMEAGFGAPRVSQTLSPTVFSSPMPNFALQTTDDPSHVHCASWKHLHAHWSIGAAEHKESATSS